MCFVLDFFFNSIPFFSLPVCLWNCDICAVLHTNQHFRDRPSHWIFAMSCHRPISSPAQCLEKFSSLTHTVSCNLDIFMRAIHDTEFPNSVDATQKLLDEQGAEYDRLKVSYKRWGVLVIWHLMPIFFWFFSTHRRRLRRLSNTANVCSTIFGPKKLKNSRNALVTWAPRRGEWNACRTIECYAIDFSLL